MKHLPGILFACLLCAAAVFAGRTEMTYEDFELALASSQQQEKVAKEQIAEEQARIESLKQQIADIEQRIALCIAEKKSILGITDSDIAAAQTEIDAIRQGLQLLLGLNSSELSTHKSDISGFETRIFSLKKKPVSWLFSIADQIPELENMLASVKANLPSYTSTYTVQRNINRRDCLIRIAGSPDVYGDVTQWPKLYRANKSRIDKTYSRYLKQSEAPKFSRAEDFIVPGEVLDIPR